MLEHVLMGLTAISFVSVLWLRFFRGGFWRADQKLPERTAARERWPGVTVVIPARNEAATIQRAVASIVRQDYPGPFNLIVVDDGSVDDTAGLAESAAEGSDILTVIRGRPLPQCWTGKLWALDQGLRHGEEHWPGTDYWLLTDADIEHDRSVLKRLVAKAEAGKLDLVSLMVRLYCGSFWERLLVPAFVFFFQKLYPFPFVNHPERAEAAAAGGCMLVRRSALTAVGGVASIRGNLIDDCALAARISRRGAVWIGLASRTRSVRVYQGLWEIWAMVARTAFTQLNHSVALVLATVVAMTVVYCVPPVALVYGMAFQDLWLAMLGGGAWLLMTAMFWPTLRLYGLPAWRGLLLPVAAFLFASMTVDSARLHWNGKGGLWKGRSYGGV
jgi:hopene-associated glycosyltransferase HpnB